MIHYEGIAAKILPHGISLFSVFNRFPKPPSHSFILDFLTYRACCYAKAEKQVEYILDLMKLDVPGLFCDPSDTSAASPGECDTSAASPGECFKKHLRTHVATSGSTLRKDLLKHVDAIMVSWSMSK